MGFPIITKMLIKFLIKGTKIVVNKNEEEKMNVLLDSYRMA